MNGGITKKQSIALLKNKGGMSLVMFRNGEMGISLTHGTIRHRDERDIVFVAQGMRRLGEEGVDIATSPLDYV